MPSRCHPAGQPTFATIRTWAGPPGPVALSATGDEALMPSDAPVSTSLARITIQRSIRVGTRYLAIGTVVSLLLTLVLLRNHGAFELTYPLEIPIFATLGSMGALLVFGNDRSKGVFEYLISYGIRPRMLFGLGLLSSAALASIVLAATIIVGFAGFLGTGGVLTLGLLEAVLLYSVPMTFGCALFSTVISMIWSTVASPRAGMNSPLGFAPMLGIGPVIIVLVAAESVPRADYYYVTVGAAFLLLLVVALLALASGELLSRERLLSPM